MAHVSPVFEQNSFRGRNDDGSETTATWKAAANTDWTQAVDENFRVRFLLRETAGGSDNNHLVQLQYNLNAAGWNDVNGTSAVVRSSPSANFNDDDHTTQQLGAGSFLTPNDGMDEDNGLAGEGNNIDFAGNDEVEVEYCVEIVGADVADEDTLELRIVGAGVGVYDIYTNGPSVTVSAAPEPQVATVTVSLDAALQEQLALVGVIDSVVERRVARSLGYDAALANARAAAAELDAAVRFLTEGTAQFDAAVEHVATRSSELDAGVAVRAERVNALDAVVASLGLATLAVDAALRSVESRDTVVDAAISDVPTLSLGLAGALAERRAAAAVMDGVARLDASVTAALDAFVQAAMAGEAAALDLDAVLEHARVLAISLSAVVRAREEVMLGLDAALGLPFSPRAPHRVPGRQRHEIAAGEKRGVPARGARGVGSDGRIYVIPPRRTIH